MKKIIVLFLFIFSFSAAFSQTLFTYGNSAVDKEEFLRAYNKNKTATTDKEKSLREYLDLYSKFKLKVRAAKDAKLDTLPQLNSDLQNFRSQVQETYMNNDNAVNALADEAFLHAQKDVHVIHFFAPVDGKATVADSAKAFKAMQELYTTLQSGKTGYDKLAADIAAKYVKVKATDIGYITVFSVPYEYEKIIYNTKNGQASKPYRTKNGWHIFKVVDERKGMGKWKIAQILFALPPGEDSIAQSKLIAKKADSVYQKLLEGENFGTMASKFSDDKLTYMSNGLMPEFTVGKYDMAFENEVFKLTKDEEISKPFATPYGFHIVKRIGVQHVQEDKNDAGYMYDIKQKVLADSRINTAKEAFIKSVEQTVGYKRNATIKDAELFRYADSVAINPAANGAKEFPVSNKIIYTSAKGNIKGAEWLHFIREYKTNPEIYKGESNAELLNKFVTLKAMDYYRSNLEAYNNEFRYQVDEFKEGNLLFEIMERKVWSSAVNDSVGLLKYYNQHKDKYLWAPSADVVVVNCSNKKTAEAALYAIKQGTDWKKITEGSNNAIQTDSGRYEIAQLSLDNNIQPAAGLITPIVVNSTDGTAGFIKIIALHPANQQRSFEEARGLVINDYQNIIEQKWLDELRKKYPVTVNEAVFQSLLK